VPTALAPLDPRRAGAWLLVAYPAIVLATCAAYARVDGTLFVVPGWILLPQVAAVSAVAARLWRGGLDPGRRTAWGLYLVGGLLDLGLTLAWSLRASDDPGLYGDVLDALWILNYLPGAASLAMLFVAAGGSLRSRRVWIDAAACAVAVLAALFPFYWGPIVNGVNATPLHVATTLGYTVGVVATFTAAALLIVQIAGRRDERSALLLALAFVICLSMDSWEVAENVRGTFVRHGLQNLGFVVGECMIAVAALIDGDHGRPPPTAPVQRSDLVPVLALLTALVVAGGAQAAERDLGVVVASGLLVLAAITLVLRQIHVHRDFARLTAEVVRRRADERLTEIARQSADVVAVADRGGGVTFVGPAIGALVGRPPEAVVGRPLAGLFGAAAAPRMSALLEELAAAPGRTAEAEFSFAGPCGARAVRVLGRNELANPLVEGHVLTFRDVTAQRGLERRVAELAASERRRLGEQLHEGLAQDLAGISFLVRSAAGGAARADGPEARDLAAVIDHLGAAIERSRELALGAAPMSVARGSLAAALELLAARYRAQGALDVRFSAALADEPGAEIAEALWQVARDVLESGPCAAGGRVDVDLAQGDGRIVLRVSHASAEPATPAAADALAALIGYRVRLVDGVCSWRRSCAGWEIAVQVPAGSRSLREP
jgi:signal transduction histidine kinase